MSAIGGISSIKTNAYQLAATSTPAAGTTQQNQQPEGTKKAGHHGHHGHHAAAAPAPDPATDPTATPTTAQLDVIA